MTLFLIATLIFVADQVSKFVISHQFRLGDSLALWQDVFHLTLVHNEGIAFGLFGRFGFFLSILIAVSVLALFVYAFRVKNQPFYFQLAYGFILGGAVGNLIDRFRVGYVIDFLDFRVWPVFNIADMFISIGIGLLVLKSFSKPHAS